MPVNKVEYFGETLIDISDSTISPEKVLKGEIGYNKAGTRFVGTAESAAKPVIKPLEVTSNGTYTAPAGVDGYSPVTVNVSSGGGEIAYVNLTIDASYLIVSYICKNTQYEALESKYSNESSLFTTVLSPKNSLISFSTGSLNVSNQVGLEYLGMQRDENYIPWYYYKIVGDENGNASIIVEGGSGGGSSDRISDTEALKIITGGEPV